MWKHAVKFIHDFEANAAEAAIAVAGLMWSFAVTFISLNAVLSHIRGAVQYLNSGIGGKIYQPSNIVKDPGVYFTGPNKFTSIQNKAAKKMTEELVFEVH
ncbi:MAG: hypothetical protein U0T81_17385 [Saprospiraceae bacterium]